MKKKSILLVEDHALLRETWRVIIDTHPSFEVIAEAPTGQQAIGLAHRLQPDIIVMDINLPDISGLEVAMIILRQNPGVNILGLSFHNHPQWARKIMQIGGKGYLSKNADTGELFEALERVAQGGKYLGKEIKNRISEHVLLECAEGDLSERLTPKEREVIGFIKEGYSSRQIAEKLSITSKTVEIHRCHILKKLKLKNAAALVDYASRHLL